MTTPLPSRLRESARLLRGLYLYSENRPVKLIDKADSTRIAAELTEAADALEAGPLDALLTQILNRRVTIEQRMFDAAAGKRQMPDAAELRDWAIELGTPAARVAQEGGGVSASAYLAKVEADPRRAAALQRARDRTPGVAERDPRCGYPYCGCVAECFAASQPGAADGVKGRR